MEKYIAYIKDGIITIQRSTYIEDGWFIEINKNIISLIEIPYGGGEPIDVGTYNTLLEAIQVGESLT